VAKFPVRAIADAVLEAIPYFQHSGKNSASTSQSGRTLCKKILIQGLVLLEFKALFIIFDYNCNISKQMHFWNNNKTSNCPAT
jgi:hypothetical protein